MEDQDTVVTQLNHAISAMDTAVCSAFVVSHALLCISMSICIQRLRFMYELTNVLCEWENQYG
jgi:hypothetical protein